jgi:hypothetical protein
VRGVDQLPGPVLAEWLVHALRPLRAAVLIRPGGKSGSGALLRARVGAAAEQCGWPVLAEGVVPEGFGALVMITALGDARVEPALAAAASAMRAGGLVVELAHPPSLRPWQVLQWLRRTRVMRSAAELRARAWLGFGLYALEQWAPVDLPRVLVTCGRRRAIPGR